jgi:hypothetical protein
MNKDPRRYERWLIGLTLVVAALFRFYPFGEVSLSNDELSALVRTRFPSFNEMIRGGVYTDFHPAGVQSFLYYWTNLLGESAFLLRLPFILSGLGSIWLIYRLGSRWFHTAAGLLAAAMFSVLEYSIIYSQLARPYSPGLFFCLLATWYWTNLSEQTADLHSPALFFAGLCSGIGSLGVHVHQRKMEVNVCGKRFDHRVARAPRMDHLSGTIENRRPRWMVG